MAQQSKLPLFGSKAALVRLFLLTFYQKITHGDRKRRRGSHPNRRGQHLHNHAPAGTKLSRKVGKPSRYGHMGGYG